MERPAVFFDRDNTLIANDGYLGDPAGVILIDGAADALARVALGYATVTFSNQSGVARGMYTEEAVHAVNARLDDLLHDQNSQATIDRHEFCPYHPGASVERYRRDSDLRKPKPGMILQAADRLGINLKGSWVIGDAPRDIEAGRAAGCRTILFKDPSLKASSAAVEPSMVAPDYTVATLREAVDIIEQSTGTTTPAPVSEGKTEEAPAAVQGAAAAANDSAGEPPAAPAATVANEASAPAAAPATAATAAPPAKPRKLTFAERVRAGTFQPARVAAAAGTAPPEKDRRTVLPTPDEAPAAPGADTPAAPVRNPHVSSDQAPDAPPVRPTQPLTTAEQLEPILQSILEELRMAREDKPLPDFSVTKLLAGIMQVLVLAALFFGYLHRDSAPDLQSMLLLAIFLQTLTMALMMMGRQS